MTSEEGNFLDNVVAGNTKRKLSNFIIINMFPKKLLQSANSLGLNLVVI